MSAVPGVAVSVVVVSRNEAELLEGCLRSVEAWADEIVVLDMECTDATVDVAQRFGAHVVGVPLRPIAEQVRQRGLDVVSNEWVVQLDPDERTPPGFVRQVQQVVAREPRAAAVRWPFTEIAFGTPVQHLLGGAAKLVVVHRARVQYADDAPAHAEPALDGPIVELTRVEVAPIEHHSYRDVAQVVEKLVRYGLSGGADQPWVHSSDFPLVRLLLRYLVRRGAWRDGAIGIEVGSLLAVQEYLSVLEHRQRSGDLRRPLQPRTLAVMGALERGAGMAVATATRARRLRRGAHR